MSQSSSLALVPYNRHIDPNYYRLHGFQNPEWYAREYQRFQANRELFSAVTKVAVVAAAILYVMYYTVAPQESDLSHFVLGGLNSAAAATAVWLSSYEIMLLSLDVDSLKIHEEVDNNASANILASVKNDKIALRDYCWKAAVVYAVASVVMAVYSTSFQSHFRTEFNLVFSFLSFIAGIYCFGVGASVHYEIGRSIPAKRN